MTRKCHCHLPDRSDIPDLCLQPALVWNGDGTLTHQPASPGSCVKGLAVTFSPTRPLASAMAIPGSAAQNSSLIRMSRWEGLDKRVALAETTPCPPAARSREGEAVPSVLKSFQRKSLHSAGLLEKHIQVWFLFCFVFFPNVSLQCGSLCLNSHSSYFVPRKNGSIIPWLTTVYRRLLVGPGLGGLSVAGTQ